MKLLIVSDVHLEFADFHMRNLPRFDVAVCAGDMITPGRKFPGWIRHPRRIPKHPVIAIAGNHEYFGSTLTRERELMRTRAKDWDVHFLDADELVLEGVRFLGATLWTDFELGIDSPTGRQVDPEYAMTLARESMADYDCIRKDVFNYLQPQDVLDMHREHRAWLEDRLCEPFPGKTVVVSHHAPHRGSLTERYADDWVSASFASELPAKFFEVPVLWAHGHTHQSADYKVGNTRVVCNPRGYPTMTAGVYENLEFKRDFVVEI